MIPKTYVSAFSWSYTLSSKRSVYHRKIIIYIFQDIMFNYHNLKLMYSQKFMVKKELKYQEEGCYLFPPMKSFKPFFPAQQLQEKKIQNTQNYRKGAWSQQENKAYIDFLIDRKEQMMHSYVRRSQKLFIQMSKLVGTRTPDQCRSHHQKIMKYHFTIEGTIDFFTNSCTSLNCKQENIPEITHHQTCKSQKDLSSDIIVKLQEDNNVKIELKREAIAKF